MAAALDGRVEAWEALVRQHYPLLLRYLEGQSRDPDDAAELAQDTFLTAIDLFYQRPPAGPFAAWLYRIAQNHLRRLWRRQAVRRAVSLDWLRDRPTFVEERLLDRTDIGAITAEREIVDSVLNGLRSPLRDALLLNCIAGLSAAEVAGVLRISQAAAERRISRAKALFRTAYHIGTEAGGRVHEPPPSRNENHGQLD